MATVRIVERIEAPAAKVWNVVSDFGDLGFLGSEVVKKVTVEGEGLGCIRSIELAAGGVIDERLESYDADSFRFSYRIVNDAPVPFENYRSMFSLRPLGAAATELEWSGNFEPKGTASEEEAIEAVQGIYQGGTAGIKAALGL